MLSDVKKHFGLKRELPRAGFFATDHHNKLLQEVRSAIGEGQLIAVAGIVGCGKTTLLRQIERDIRAEKKTLVSRAMTVDKDRINLGTLITALFYDLSTDKEFKVPTQPEKRERGLLELIRTRGKPIVLFVDEAHDLHSKTLVQLKRLVELVSDNDGKLSVVLAGHPKLKNDLRLPSLEEIGARTSVFTLEGIQGQQREYIEWLLKQCTKADTPRDTLVSDEAVEQLAERLVTPLQMELYLMLAFEEAYQVGQKPVTPEIIDAVLSKQLDDLEPNLIRHGYNTQVLSRLLNTRQAEVRSFLHGQLPPGRTEEIRNELLRVGIPL
jgi:type II secretory pathway predicted ATPase ExeA